MNRKEVKDKLDEIRLKKERRENLTHKEEQIWAYGTGPCKCAMGVGSIRLPGSTPQRVSKYWRNDA